MDNVKNPDIWDYFIPRDDLGHKIAECKLCSKCYCYKTTITNLKLHLMKIHTDKVNVKFNLKLKKTQSETGKRKLKLIWRYFSKVEGQDNLAKCLVCSQDLSYRTTSSNLKRHLHQHPVEYENLQRWEEKCQQESTQTKAEADEYEEEVYLEYGNPVSPQSAWLCFELETGGRARCILCGVSLSADDDAVSSHVALYHPGIVAEEETESNNEEDTFQEKGTSDEKTHPHSIKKIKLHPSSTEQQKDEIDSFTDYINALLRNVPSDLCSKLQMDIVNLVMKAKMDHEGTNTRIESKIPHEDRVSTDFNQVDRCNDSIDSVRVLEIESINN